VEWLKLRMRHLASHVELSSDGFLQSHVVRPAARRYAHRASARAKFARRSRGSVTVQIRSQPSHPYRRHFLRLHFQTFLTQSQRKVYWRPLRLVDALCRRSAMSSRTVQCVPVRTGNNFRTDFNSRSQTNSLDVTWTAMDIAVAERNRGTCSIQTPLRCGSMLPRVTAGISTARARKPLGDGATREGRCVRVRFGRAVARVEGNSPR